MYYNKFHGYRCSHALLGSKGWSVIDYIYQSLGERTVVCGCRAASVNPTFSHDWHQEVRVTAYSRICL